MAELLEEWERATGRALSKSSRAHESYHRTIEAGTADAQDAFLRACRAGSFSLVQSLWQHYSDRIDLGAVNGGVFEDLCRHGNVDMLRWLLDITGPQPLATRAWCIRAFFVSFRYTHFDIAAFLFESCGGWANDPRFEKGDYAFRCAAASRNSLAARLLMWCEARLDAGERHIDLHASNEWVMRTFSGADDVSGARWYNALCNGARFGGPTPILPQMLSELFVVACKHDCLTLARWLVVCCGVAVPGLFTSRAASGVLTANGSRQMSARTQPGFRDAAEVGEYNSFPSGASLGSIVKGEPTIPMQRAASPPPVERDVDSECGESSPANSVRSAVDGDASALPLPLPDAGCRGGEASKAARPTIANPYPGRTRDIDDKVLGRQRIGASPPAAVRMADPTHSVVVADVDVNSEPDEADECLAGCASGVLGAWTAASSLLQHVGEWFGLSSDTPAPVSRSVDTQTQTRTQTPSMPRLRIPMGSRRR